MKNQVYTELDESLCWSEHNSPFSSENLRIFWFGGTLNPNPDTFHYPTAPNPVQPFLGHSQRCSSHRKTSSKERNPPKFLPRKTSSSATRVLGGNQTQILGWDQEGWGGRRGKITFFSPHWLSWWAWPWVLGAEPCGTAAGRPRWCRRAGAAPAARTWPRFWSSACTKTPKITKISPHLHRVPPVLLSRQKD